MNSLQLAWKIRRHGIEMTHISQGLIWAQFYPLPI